MRMALIARSRRCFFSPTVAVVSSLKKEVTNYQYLRLENDTLVTPLVSSSLEG